MRLILNTCLYALYAKNITSANIKTIIIDFIIRYCTYVITSIEYGKVKKYG